MASTPALTTPASCTPSWVAASEATLINDGATTVRFITANASCLATSLDSAVCPSSWTYYDLGISSQVSTAWCCDAGFTLDVSHSLVDVTSTACWYTEATPSVSTATFGDGDWDIDVFAHEPWRITWASSDASTLSPSPPQLTASSVMPVWYPDSARNIGSDRIRTYSGPMWIVVIGLPVIGALILAGIGWYFFRRNRRTRIGAIQEFVLSSRVDLKAGEVRKFPPKAQPTTGETAIVQFVANQAAKD